MIALTDVLMEENTGVYTIRLKVGTNKETDNYDSFHNPWIFVGIVTRDVNIYDWNSTMDSRCVLGSVRTSFYYYCSKCLNSQVGQYYLLYIIQTV